MAAGPCAVGVVGVASAAERKRVEVTVLETNLVEVDGDLGDLVCMFCSECRRFLCNGDSAGEPDDDEMPDDTAVTCAECIERDELSDVCPWCGDRWERPNRWPK